MLICFCPLAIVESQRRRVCRNGFEPFGGLKSAFRAANEGHSSQQEVKIVHSFGSSSESSTMAMAGDLEIVCVAFDVLYVKDQVPLSPPSSPILSSDDPLILKVEIGNVHPD